MPSKKDWMDGGLEESSGKVRKAKIRIRPLSESATVELESSEPKSTKKKKIYRPRPPRQKGDVTEKTFQYLRGRQGDKKYESQMDEFLKSNPEYKEDTKLKKIRIRTRKK